MTHEIPSSRKDSMHLGIIFDAMAAEGLPIERVRAAEQNPGDVTVRGSADPSGSLLRCTAEGSIMISDDNGTTWWTEYDANQDIYYQGPDDLVGYHL